MKHLVFLSFFFVLWSKFNRIAEINALKEQAAVYYQNSEYEKSINLYELLLTEYRETDDFIKLNLANAYFQLRYTNKAIGYYRSILKSPVSMVRSTAYMQLGVIYSSNKKKDLALTYFKEALKALPENEEARFNYELIKKEQAQETKENSTDKKKESAEGKNKSSTSISEEIRNSNSDGQTKNPSTANDMEFGDTENTGGEELESDLDYDENGNKETNVLRSKRFKEVYMSEHQARMILKNMRYAEIQYIQQQQRKINTTKQIPQKQDW